MDDQPQPTTRDPRARRRLWWAVAPAMVAPTLLALLYFVVFQQATFSRPIYVASKLFILLWPLLAVCWILRRRPHLRSRPWSHHARSLVPGLLIGVAIVAAMVAWMLSPLRGVILSGSDGVRAKVESLGFLDHFIAFAVFITVAHSFIEEYYWRWFVFGHLRELVQRRFAHAIAATAFAGHHFVVTAQYYPLDFALFLSYCVAIGGLIWSALYQRYDSLLGPWVCHLCVDAGLMWVGYHMIYAD